MQNRQRILLGVFAATAIAGTACTMNSTEIPGMTGPSEFALAYQIAAVPDTIRHDGIDASSLVVSVRDANGQPKSGVAFRLDILVDGVPAEYGRLSSKTIVSGGDGTARATYISPPAPSINMPLGACGDSGAFLLGSCVQIAVTPVGSNLFGERPSQFTNIHLIPPGFILPPQDPTAPIASFTFTPPSPRVAQEVFLTAESSTPYPGRSIVSYKWSFGDGIVVTRSSPLEDHDWAAPGIYPIVLTVTDDAGFSGTASATIVVLP
jgi:hypothetical protein